MIALTLVFSAILKPQIENYPVYFLTGSLFWTFFAQTTAAATSQTQESNEMARRIYIPRSVFAASTLAVGLVNLALAVVPFAGSPHRHRIPPARDLVVPSDRGHTDRALHRGGGSSPPHARFALFRRPRDDQVLVQIWFFLTPIVYHPAIVPPKVRFALWLNPLYYLVQTFRKPVYDGVLPSPGLVGASLALSVIVFLSGWIYFANRADRFAYES